MAIYQGSAYEHTQSIAAATWTITHNMNRMPSVQVTVTHKGAVRAILPKDIIHVDNSTVRVEFSSPWVGTARLI